MPSKWCALVHRKAAADPDTAACSKRIASARKFGGGEVVQHYPSLLGQPDHTTPGHHDAPGPAPASVSSTASYTRSGPWFVAAARPAMDTAAVAPSLPRPPPTSCGCPRRVARPPTRHHAPPGQRPPPAQHGQTRSFPKPEHGQKGIGGTRVVAPFDLPTTTNRRPAETQVNPSPHPTHATPPHWMTWL